MSMEIWDKVYKKYGTKKPEYDDWLDKFMPVIELSGDIPVIDLGCGFGNDTLYLKERGFNVISCDYSIEALNRLDYFIENPEKRHFDMRNKFPFETDSAKIVIADLSLHYFSEKETEAIIAEISRLLENNGFLLGRVNSVNDINYGAGQGEKIEENFYNVNGDTKRFFDKNHIDFFFRNWDIRHIEERSMNRYEKKKIVWEFSAGNIKS